MVCYSADDKSGFLSKDGTASKKQYSYLKAPLKSIVDEIVDDLEKNPAGFSPGTMKHLLF